MGTASTTLSCLYTSPFMKPKEAIMQRDESSVKAVVEAIRMKRELIRNGGIEAIRWGEIPDKPDDKGKFIKFHDAVGSRNATRRELD